MSMTSPISSGRLQDRSDRFDTPPSLAANLIELVSIDRVTRVADFACGIGNLLNAASVKWPEASLHAIDVDLEALAETRRIRGVAVAECADFLDPAVHESAELLGASAYSVVLLNPPFTYRGGELFSPPGRFSGIRCSRPMAFVLSAASYLAPDGQLVAVLPTSTLSSMRDDEARRLLSSRFTLEIAMAPALGHFDGLNVSIYVLRLTHNKGAKSRAPSPRDRERDQRWMIRQGKISVRRAERVVSRGGKGWIHTTSLRDGEIDHRYRLPAGVAPRQTEKGSVLIPRVGAFSVGKVLLLGKGQSEMTSDCLIEISAGSHSDNEVIYETIKARYRAFSNLYSGTGAPYVTGRLVDHFLKKHVR